MSRARLALLVLLGALALGCEPTIPEGRFACVADDDCPPGLVCRENLARCYRTATPDDAPDGG